MTALLSAELLRLTTVRSTRYVFLGVLAVVAISAAPVGNPPPSSASEVVANLRGLAQLGALWAALYAANTVGDAFRRGSVAMTYLTHPLRTRVTAAQAIAYGGVGLVLAALTAAASMGIVLTVADADHVDAGFSVADVVRVVGGAAFAGAVFGAAGALAGAVARHPGIATGAVVVWSLAETVFTRGGTTDGFGPYLPFQLIGSLTGLSDGVAVVAAMSLLLAYLGVLALAVGKWAVPRDLT
jgi:ABC-2 type transport system permease protein